MNLRVIGRLTEAAMRLPENEEQEIKKTEEPRKPYEKPAIVHELTLETKAGSTLGLFPDPLDDEFTQ